MAQWFNPFLDNITFWLSREPLQLLGSGAEI